MTFRGVCDIHFTYVRGCGADKTDRGLRQARRDRLAALRPAALLSKRGALARAVGRRALPCKRRIALSTLQVFVAVFRFEIDKLDFAGCDQLADDVDDRVLCGLRLFHFDRFHLRDIFFELLTHPL